MCPLFVIQKNLCFKFLMISAKTNTAKNGKLLDKGNSILLLSF